MEEAANIFIVRRMICIHINFILSAAQIADETLASFDGSISADTIQKGLSMAMPVITYIGYFVTPAAVLAVTLALLFTIFGFSNEKTMQTGIAWGKRAAAAWSVFMLLKVILNYVFTLLVMSC